LSWAEPTGRGFSRPRMAMSALALTSTSTRRNWWSVQTSRPVGMLIGRTKSSSAGCDVREVMRELASLWEAGATVGMGTVVAILGSSPREQGASMVVGPKGEVVGSVSGGCVEAAVYELSRKAATTGAPALVRYGISGGDPYAPDLRRQAGCLRIAGERCDVSGPRRRGGGCGRRQSRGCRNRRRAP
jgi:hypothetical protein